jgi:hypothetical protein
MCGPLGACTVDLRNDSVERPLRSHPPALVLPSFDPFALGIDPLSDPQPPKSSTRIAFLWCVTI